MSVRDVGDRMAVRYESRNPDGVLTNATVTLAVTDPAGVVTNPSVTNTSTGVYDATFDLNAVGLWRWKWTASGAVVDVAYDSIAAQDPAPGIYAALAELKERLGGITDGNDDDRFRSALMSASREIDGHCSGRGNRQFWPVTTAAARLFHPTNAGLAVVDDFWTTTGLIIETDEGDTGSYSTVWTTADYQLEPLNGVVSGEQGWPYYQIRAIGTRRFPCYRRATLRVTAKWGWMAIPSPVREACLLMAEETAKLADSPFGVGGYGQFGIVRVRDNPMAARKLHKYLRDPVLVA